MEDPTMTVRERITIRGLNLSYVDFGGSGTPLLALHGHFGRARMWSRIAAGLAPTYRVVALEQRAHGDSDRGADLHPDSYVADAAEFLRVSRLSPLPVLGHSMGGVVAYRLAARHPELVTGFAAIDSGARVEPPTLDPRPWPRRTNTLAELRGAIEAHGVLVADYFLESAVERPDGWGLLFDYDDLLESQQALLGEWWPGWLGSSCPALLVHGEDSTGLATDLARDMAARRDQTRLAVFPGRGHWVHDDDPAGVCRVLREFLSELIRVR